MVQRVPAKPITGDADEHLPSARRLISNRSRFLLLTRSASAASAPHLRLQPREEMRRHRGAGQTQRVDQLLRSLVVVRAQTSNGILPRIVDPPARLRRQTSHRPLLEAQRERRCLQPSSREPSSRRRSSAIHALPTIRRRSSIFDAMRPQLSSCKRNRVDGTNPSSLRRGWRSPFQGKAPHGGHSLERHTGTGTHTPTQPTDTTHFLSPVTPINYLSFDGAWQTRSEV